jgi:hypothetical protein
VDRQIKLQLVDFGPRPSAGFCQGQSVADMVPNQIADVEIRALCDVVLRQLAKATGSPR